MDQKENCTYFFSPSLSSAISPPLLTTTLFLYTVLSNLQYTSSATFWQALPRQLGLASSLLATKINLKRPEVGQVILCCVSEQSRAGCWLQQWRGVVGRGGVGQEPLVSKLKAVSNSTGNKNISFFDNCVDVLNISDRFCMMCRNCKWPGSTVVLECFYWRQNYVPDLDSGPSWRHWQIKLPVHQLENHGGKVEENKIAFVSLETD